MNGEPDMETGQGGGDGCQGEVGVVAAECLADAEQSDALAVGLGG